MSEPGKRKRLKFVLLLLCGLLVLGRGRWLVSADGDSMCLLLLSP